MELTLNDLLTVAGVAVVTGLLVQVLKRWIAEDLIPVLALVVGIALAVAASVALGLVGAENLGNAVLTGLLGGSAAIGLYETQSHTRRAVG
jgi:hypothetical protein